MRHPVAPQQGLAPIVPQSPSGRSLSPLAAVWLLALSQIVGYGTLYYSFATLAHGAALTLGWPESWLFGVFSVGLLLGGLVAPEIGRRMDRHGAASVMTVGTVVSSVALLAAGTAPNGVVFAVAIVVMQVAGTLALYDAAFTALVQVAGPDARRRITHLTLIAGFTSTIFWPLTAWLEAPLGWRNVYMIFAVANVVICTPIHLFLSRRHATLLPVHSPDPSAGVGSASIAHPSAMWFATIGFALSSFALSAVLTQMVPLLTAVGLGASALLVSALFGPAQVLIRFVNLVLGAGRHPIVATLVALTLLPSAFVVLALGAPAITAAVAFAVMFGFASGLKSIVQGSLPLALFGPGAYGARLGLMSSVRQVLAAVAPFAMAFAAEGFGVRPALLLVATVGLLGLLCLAQVARLVRRGAGPGLTRS